jgi:hypothetical protein
MRAKHVNGDLKRLSALRIRFGDHLQPALNRYTSLVGEVIFTSNSLHTSLLVLLKALFPDDGIRVNEIVGDNEEMASDIWHSLGSDASQRGLLCAIVRHSKRLSTRQRENILWAVDAAGRLAEFRNDAVHTAFELEWDELDDPVRAKFRPSEEAPPRRVQKLQRIGHEKLFKALIGDLNQLRDYITAIWIFVLFPKGGRPRLPDKPVLKSALLIQKNPPNSTPPPSNDPLDKVKLVKRRIPNIPGRIPIQRLGYVAGSKSDADHEKRVFAVGAARCHHIFVENHKAKLKRRRRDCLHLLLKHIQRGDTVIVFDFSSLADNGRQLLNVLDQFKSQGARLRSLTEPDIKPFTRKGRILLSNLHKK